MTLIDDLSLIVVINLLNSFRSVMSECQFEVEQPAVNNEVEDSTKTMPGLRQFDQTLTTPTTGKTQPNDHVLY